MAINETDRPVNEPRFSVEFPRFCEVGRNGILRGGNFSHEEMELVNDLAMCKSLTNMGRSNSSYNRSFR